MPLIFILSIQFPTGGCLRTTGTVALLVSCEKWSCLYSLELGIEALKKEGEDRGGGGGGLIHGNL